MSDIPANTPNLPELPSSERESAEAQAHTPAPPTRVWKPSARLTAALAAAMLAIGVAVGAAIGPSPDASFAGASEYPAILQSLLAGAKRAAPAPATAASASAGTEEAPAAHRKRRRRRAATAAAGAETAATESAGAADEGSPSSPTKGSGESPKAKPLPPVTKVWVVQLDGTGFEEAFAAPTSAAYIDTQAVPSGSYLNGWSSLAASTFASNAALISTKEPQVVQTITQPACPEGAAGASCAPGSPGAIAAADGFLKQTLTTLTASSAYKTNGLIVVTFAVIASGASSELPAGSTTATLASQPSGALLISPFVTKGARPTTTFNATSPRQSLEALLHR